MGKVESRVARPESVDVHGGMALAPTVHTDAVLAVAGVAGQPSVVVSAGLDKVGQRRTARGRRHECMNMFMLLRKGGFLVLLFLTRFSSQDIVAYDLDRQSIIQRWAGHDRAVTQVGKKVYKA